MPAAIPVPGQPGRLWIPGVGVVDQRQPLGAMSEDTQGKLIMFGGALVAVWLVWKWKHRKA